MKGLRERKGAPETFDVNGFMDLLKRLKKKDEVYVPDFDRQTEQTINSHIRYQTIMTWLS